MTETEYLGLEDVLSLVRRLGIGPVRDLGLLDSALARPRSSAFGEDAYPTLELKAAALLHSLCANHPLVDGNKRLGWLSTAVFLEINGVAASGITNDAVYDLVIWVASTNPELNEIVGRLRALL